jgi:hypothetical protein
MVDESIRRKVHELNNRFQILMASLELLKRSPEPPRDIAKDALETALRAANEASLLAQELIAALRKD